MDENVVYGYKPLRSLTKISFGKMMLDSLRNSKCIDEEALKDAITGDSITFKYLLEKSCQLAYSMKAYGCQKNDVVSIISENNIDFFHPVLSAFYLGVIIVPLNPNYSKGELLHAMNITKPKIIFSSKLCLKKIVGVRGTVNFLQKIVVINKHAEANNSSPGDVENIDSFLRRHVDKKFNSKNFETVDVDVDDQTALILFSSGTTGLPKGVMITHKNILVRTEHLNDPRISFKEREHSLLGLLPFFHAYGLFLSLGAMIRGVKVITLSKFDENVFLRTIQGHKISILRLVPPLVVFLAKSPLVDKYDLKCVKEIASGAAPLSKEIEDAVKARFNIRSFRQAYGLTETTLGVTAMPENEEGKRGSVGKLLSYMACKVCDPETGKTLGKGQAGELCFKGDLVMKGYYNDEKATREAIDDEKWLHTGDVGYYDEDGYFFIVDRLKELIKYKGFQVPPAELEALLLNHPKIKDAGVVGVPNEEAGELPLAFVVKRHGVNLTEKDVEQFVTENVSSPKRLRGGVIFIDAIPRNASGKILRKDLRIFLQRQRSKL